MDLRRSKRPAWEEIELPSGRFGNSGTTVQCVAQPGVPRDPYETLASRTGNTNTPAWRAGLAAHPWTGSTTTQADPHADDLGVRIGAIPNSNR